MNKYSPGDLVWYFRPGSQKSGGGLEYLATVLGQKNHRVSIKIMGDHDLKRNVSVNSLRQSAHTKRWRDKPNQSPQTSTHDGDRIGSPSRKDVPSRTR